MTTDSRLRTALVSLAAVVAVVGVLTLSWKKAVVTYAMGMAGVAGVFLPDWDYFDRYISLWFQPITVDHINPGDVQRPGSTRFRFYPMRSMVYATIYGYGLYKWWSYILS